MTFLIGLLFGLATMAFLGFILAVRETEVLRSCEHKYSASISQLNPQLLLFIECKKCGFMTSYITDKLTLNDIGCFTEIYLLPEELEEIRKSKNKCFHTN